MQIPPKTRDYHRFICLHSVDVLSCLSMSSLCHPSCPFKVYCSCCSRAFVVCCHCCCSVAVILLAGMSSAAESANKKPRRSQESIKPELFCTQPWKLRSEESESAISILVAELWARNPAVAFVVPSGPRSARTLGVARLPGTARLCPFRSLYAVFRAHQLEVAHVS